MRSKLLLALGAMWLVAVTPIAWAQGTAAQFLFFNVKSGARLQFEDAIKQQMAARRAENATWRWLAWEYASGELPRYCLASFGHDWSDFDLSVTTAQVEENRVAAAAALSTQPPTAQYFEHLKEVSDFGTATNTPTMAEVSLYRLHYGKEAQFYAALRAFHEALRRAGNGSRYEWFELRSGGETPQFMLLVPRANWAAFDLNGNPLFDSLEKALGKRGATKVFGEFTSAVKSHERSAVKLRPDLSLLPAAADLK